MRHLIPVLAIITGCAHQPVATIDPTHKRPKVIRISEMPEEMAILRWQQTGVYRGLTDEQWIDVMIALEAIQDQEREKNE